MQVVSVYDLDNTEAIQASINIRRNLGHKKDNIGTVREAVSIIGGRLSHLYTVSKAHDMLEMANHLKSVERGWLLSRIGLIEDFDSDVINEVGTIPQPTFINVSSCILAKVEFLLLAPPARVREAEEGAGG